MVLLRMVLDEGASTGLGPRRRLAQRRFGWVAAMLMLAATSLGDGHVYAAPKVGSRAPKVAVAEDPDGHVVQLGRLAGKTIIVFYEDRDRAEVNATLKDELADLKHDRGFRKRVHVVAVADTSGYDFWPAKGFAKSAIRKKTKQYGLRIYCDWDGSFRGAFEFRPATANVVIVSPRGRILFAREGKLTEVEVKQAVSLLLRRR